MPQHKTIYINTEVLESFKYSDHLLRPLLCWTDQKLKKTKKTTKPTFWETMVAAEKVRFSVFLGKSWFSNGDIVTGAQALYSDSI